MMLKRINPYLFSMISPLHLFQQRKLHYQHTSQLLSQTDFISKEQAKIQPNIPLSIYCGYDPTAESLHLGNLVSIIMMARCQHLLKLRPIFLLGGATGLIGDPSGKKQQRDLLAEDRVNFNLSSIQQEITQVYSNICEDLLNNSEQYGMKLQANNLESLFINNNDFYESMNVVSFLRDIGKVLRMNNLLGKQIVANRLQSENGISYTQFSYSILQSYDFHVLNKKYGCALQFGGSDQWGNITNGCDLIRRLSKGKSQGYGITMPLLLTKNGQKFGKSQGNALYLNNKKTPTSQVYDYFLNTPDDEVEKLLSIFTFYSTSKISDILQEHKTKPEQRLAQKILAEKVTKWLGSYKNVKEQLIKVSEEELKNKNQEEIREIFSQLPADMKGTIKFDEEQQVKTLPDLLVKIGLCKSRNEARRDFDGVYLNNVKVSKTSTQQSIVNVLKRSELKGSYVLIRKGKKKYFLLNFKI